MNDNSVRPGSCRMHGRQQGNLITRRKIVSLIFGMMVGLSLVGCNLPGRTATAANTSTPVPAASGQPGGLLPDGWAKKVSNISWVAYTPPSANPNISLEATTDEITADLEVLKKAGFSGLVTYTSAGIMGSELPALARKAGFDGLIMGIWDPDNPQEYEAAVNAAKNNIVLGYCIGNEGLNKPGRYDMSKLSNSIQKLRQATGKPVTTTEEIDDYYDENLLQLGDWVFPNAHPYFHDQREPGPALQWTQGVYDDLKKRTDRFILLKEVGMPTAGDNDVTLSEENQEQFFVALAKTAVKFVYFEAFDHPWRTSLPIESHWGLFNSDRTPKLLGWQLMGKVPPPTQQTPDMSFYVYKDDGSPDNHFSPSGYMGDTGDIHLNQAYAENPHSGSTALEVVYDAAGAGPSSCEGSTPCKWGGVYWLEPPKNWGLDAEMLDKGYDLSGYSHLKLWARSDRPCTIKFLVGGIDQPYGDSLKSPKEKVVKLSQEWREVAIDLAGADLSHIIGGFAWIADQNTVLKQSCTFYLDDIRFEK